MIFGKKKMRFFSVKNVVGFTASAVILWAFTSFFVFSDLVIPVNRVREFSHVQLANSMKECRFDGEEYLVSDSEDSWIVLQVPDTGYRILEIEVEDLVEDVGLSQIFYADEGSFTSERKISFVLNKGTNIVRLPKEDILRLRLDLTDRTGVKIKIADVRLLCFEQKEAVRFYVLYTVLLGFLAIIMSICRIKKTTVKELYQGIILSEKNSLWFVAVLVTAVFFAAYGKFLLEDTLYLYRDIGADTMNLHIPGFYAFAGYIRNGQPDLWNYANICGSSNLSFFLNCANPFLFAVTCMGAVFGEQTMVYGLLAAQYVQILLGTLFCFKLLVLYGVSNRAKIAASLIFAFNGFQILWGQHYGFAIYGLINIAVIYCIENYLQRKTFGKYLCIIFLTALSGMISVYMSYMVLFMAGFYALHRILKNEKKKMAALAELFVAVILGLGISSVLFVPDAVDLLGNSTRLSSNMGIMEKIVSNLTDPYSADQVKDISTRLLSNNLLGVSNRIKSYTNYYEVPQLFFSCFSISLFVQYFFLLFRKQMDKKHKVLSYIAYGMVLILIYNKAGSLIFNGFVYAFGRYTFLIMPIFAIVSAITIDDILLRGLRSYIGLAVSTVVNIYLLHRAYIQMPDENRFCIQVIIGIQIAAALFFGFFVITKKSTDLQKNIYFIALLALIAVDVSFDSYITVYERGIMGRGSYAQSQEKIDTVRKIVNSIRAEDGSYFRIEKTFTDFSIGDAYMEGYDGITGYNNTMNEEFAEFRDYYMPGMYSYERPYRPKYQPIKYQFDKMGLLGVKYILSDYEMPDYHQYLTLIDVQDGCYIYQNNLYQSFQQFFSNVYDFKDFIRLPYKDKTEVLKNHIVMKERSHAGRIEKAEEVTDDVIAGESGKEKVFQKICLDDGEYLAASFCVSSDNDAADLSMEVYTATGNVYEYMIQTLKQKEYYFLLPENIDRIVFSCKGPYSYDISDFKVFKDSISDETIAEGMLVKSGSRMNGNTTAAEDGYLFLPIVYQDGWTLEVDGKPAELLRADSGFMAFYLTKGEHDYCIRYEIPGMKVGACITILSLFVTAAMAGYKISMKRRSAR